MLLRRYVLNHVLPVFGFLLHLVRIHIEWDHLKSLLHLASFSVLFARTNVGTVATTQAVHDSHLYAELHALELFWSVHVNGRQVAIFCLVLVKNKWANGSVWARISTLVTLNTIFGMPLWHDGFYATLLISGCAVLPSTVHGAMLHEV